MRRDFDRLPDLSGFESEEAGKVKELITEHTEKLSEWRSLKVKHESVRSSLNDAVATDKRARAEALRAGKPDPGHKAEEKAKAELAKIVDRMTVLEVVISNVEADLAKALSEAKPALIKEASKARDRAHAQYAQARMALFESHERFLLADGLVKWFESPSPYFSPSPARNEVLNVPGSLKPEDDPNEGTVRLRVG